MKRPAVSERLSGVMRNLPTVNGNEEIEDIKNTSEIRADAARIHASHAVQQSMGNGAAVLAANVRLAK